MNTMPELKAGMIIKSSISDSFFLYINELWAMSLSHDREWTVPKELNKDWVTEIYESVHHSKTYSTCLNNVKLIWSKKSDTDIKIDELTETIKKASEELEELRKGIK